MTDNTDPSNSSERLDFKSVKAESVLPTKTVGIECLKEANPETMSPHRNIFKWFARRPTAATRLAILASILPSEVSDDELLNYLCVGPKESLNEGLSDYVLRKYSTKDDRGGTIEEHFGYEYPHRRVPSESEFDDLHKLLKEHWSGNLPVVLDPTAGGGTIPLEALRYRLPTISNELNPVAWLLNKVILEYAVSVGSVESELEKWMSEIEDIVEQELSEYFPKRNGIAPSHYYRAYSIECPACGGQLPITNRWYFNRRRNAAVYPLFEEDGLRFEVIDPAEYDTREDYDPNSGTISGGDAECPQCGVVTERSDIVEIFNNGEYEFEVCGVRYEQSIGGSKYHSPTEDDLLAVERARKKVESDLRLSTILSTERFEGYYDRAVPYGVEQWRDVYSPRQLLTHATYLDAFEQVSTAIQSEYSDNKAKLILTILSFIPVKLISRNSRLNPMSPDYGSPSDMLGDNNFSFKWHFAESNQMVGTYSYQSEAKNIVESYEETVEYVEHVDEPATVSQGDAANLSYDDSSVQSVVVDPPYGDNIVYSEISDAFYVWLREYLGDTFPDTFSGVETNKEDEAVENPALAEQSETESASDVARRRYEEKMSKIFSEVYRVLEPGGTLTIYFTDKEIDAWDSLTMSIIQSGFVISATHTITSEIPSRIGVQEDASADSTLLLTCRKPAKEPDNRVPTLWRDIQEKTKKVARKEAEKLLDSQHNLTKTDMIISAFGPTLRVFTQEFPVVDDKDNEVRPKEALAESRTAVTEVLVERELSEGLDGVDSLTKWYILSWLVYESDSIPYDEARQLGLGVGVEIDELKRETKIWGQSKDTLLLKGQSDRVRDYTAIEAGEKRRKRAYPVNPQDQSFDYNIDAVHAALNVLQTKGGDFAWNWLQDRDLQNSPWFPRTVKSLLQVMPQTHPDYELLVNLASGETGELLDIEKDFLNSSDGQDNSRTTLQDFE
jgi:adenine-specific DNA methylase